MLVVAIVYGIAALTTSFDDSIRYSKATKEFVSALILAIDRGNTNAAHAELRKFDSVSVETYEGGSFLGWLRDAVKRLSEDATIDSDSDTVTDEHTAETAAQVGE